MLEVFRQGCAGKFWSSGGHELQKVGIVSRRLESDHRDRICSGFFLGRWLGVGHVGKG
jgi:hypothetical protein